MLTKRDQGPRIIYIRQLRRSNDSLMIEGVVNGKKLTCTVDTGAAVSLIRGDLLPTSMIQLTSPNVKLKTVTGENASVLGEAEIVLHLGRLQLPHKVYVANIEDEFILGMDVIKQHGLTYNKDLQILRLGNEELFLTSSENSVTSVRLIATENVYIPGNMEVIIKASLCSDPGCSVGLVESTEGDQPKLLVARTLVKIKKEVPVRIANIFSYRVKITRGDVVAKLEPIREVIHNEYERYSPKKGAHEEVIRKLENTWSHLSKEEMEIARNFIRKEGDVFENEQNTGRTNLVKHRIYTGEAHPIKQPPRKLPLLKQQEAEKLVGTILKEGVIEESNSPWSSPVVLVAKKDGSLRFCVDYRKLNDVTKKDSYPLPRIDDTLTTLSGSQWFSTLDLKSGYWQVGIHEDDKE